MNKNEPTKAFKQYTQDKHQPDFDHLDLNQTWQATDYGFITFETYCLDQHARRKESR